MAQGTGKGGHDWRAVARTTLLGVGGCMAVSLGLTYLLLFMDALTPFGRSLLLAIAVPLVIGVPLGMVIAVQREDIRRLRQSMNRATTYDVVTGSYNGAVFASEVDRRTRRAEGDDSHGAFLIVEFAQLRGLNRRYGHAWGDEALRAISAAVRANVRTGDVVGRIGADELGIFLPGARAEDAETIARRIQSAVSQVWYAPDGAREALRVTIGGVLSRNEVDFDLMFKAASNAIEGASADHIAISPMAGNA